MVDIGLPKLYINQNVVILIVGLFALGFAEYYKLYALFWVGLIISIIMSGSVCISMTFYPNNYKYTQQQLSYDNK